MRGVALVLVASVAVAGCNGKPSAKALQNLEESWAEMNAARARIAAIHAALPAPGAEQEKACAGPVDGETLATIGESRLRHLAGGEAAPDADEKVRFLERGVPVFMSQAEYDEVRASGKLSGVANNLRGAKRNLDAREHIVVYRPTEVATGKIGAVSGKEFAIERPAKWEGWAFVYRNAEPPALVGAFPVSAETPPDLRLAVTKGRRPADWQLLQDVSRSVQKRTIERLGRPGCAAE